MEPEQAELSSLSSVLDDLTARVTALADTFARAKREELSVDLYEVERNLRTANRRLAKVVARTTPKA